jgi:hypothetical protein
VKLRTYAMKPMGVDASRALACVSSTDSPWATFDAIGVQVRHTANGAGRPKGLSEGSTV